MPNTLITKREIKLLTAMLNAQDLGLKDQAQMIEGFKTGDNVATEPISKIIIGALLDSENNIESAEQDLTYAIDQLKRARRILTDFNSKA
jgi:hypothetical protein